MRSSVFFAALWAGVVCAPASALAGQGDQQLRFISGHEIGIVRHPALDPQPASWPKVYLPRFGLNYVYGLSRGFNVGAGIEATLQSSLATKFAGYQGQNPIEVVAVYNDLLIPMILETRLHEPESLWAWLAEFSTGLSIMHWKDSALTSLASQTPLPFLPGNLWRFAWFGRVSMAREWRPNDDFALRIGVLAGVKSQGDLHFGLFVSGDWLWLNESL